MPRAGAEVSNSCAAAPVVWLAAGHALLENAAAVSTWHAKRTWRRRCVSIVLCPCAHATRTLTSSQERTSPGCGTSGTEIRLMEAWLDRPIGRGRQKRSPLVVNTHLQLCKPDIVMAWLDRPWWKPVGRIGEAKNPGPLVCTCNTGGWSRAEGLLSMGHDLILLQETFLLQAKIPAWGCQNGHRKWLFQLLHSR
eukprot:5237098-Amphidinium_carterae.1